MTKSPDMKHPRTEEEKLFIRITLIIFPTIYFFFLLELVVWNLYFRNGKEWEGLGDIYIMTMAFFLSMFLFHVAIKRKRVGRYAPAVALLLIMIMIPEVVVNGGGDTGKNFWFLAGALYIVIMLDGRKRIVFLLIDAVWTGLFGILSYYYDFSTIDSREIQFINSYMILYIVAVMVIIMVAYEIRLKQESMRKIKEQNEEIDSLNKSQSRFFSSMSHEIRTPINTIIGLNEMILRENVSTEINENATNIQSASRMLLHLINDILDMSKFESGQMQLTMGNYNTGNMLSDIVNMLWLRAKEKGLAFHINVSPDLPEELNGDEVRIKQILINVLNNAIKYTNEGSVTLGIQSDMKDDGTVNVIYTVTDTGMGIKKESIPLLFTAFRRVDEEKNRYIEGTGLGLAIVKQFVDLMGGKITVNSVYTKGSTFVIEIPQRVVSSTPIGEVDMEKRHNIQTNAVYRQQFEAPEAKVLIVDDTAANLLVVSKLLRATRVKVTCASSGAEALERTLEDHYHVILMDHMMPKMDGIECMHRIRKQVGGRCKESKIVALTANAGSENAMLYSKEGFDGYLVKPVTGESLESELLRQLPKDLVTLVGNGGNILEESLSWISDHQKKAHVAITTESVADLPKELTEKYKIAVLPHMVETQEGIFRDGIEIEQQGLLAYMDIDSNKVNTLAPDVEAHEAFFAEKLSHAYNVVHISISSLVTHSGCTFAMEACRAFDNVFVVDSGHLSSGQGLMALRAAQMAQEGRSAEEIVAEMERMKRRVHTSFIVNDLDYLARANQVGRKMANITKAFMIHPVLVLKKGRMKVGRVYLGSRKQAWSGYIASALEGAGRIDTSILFVTYVGISQNDLNWIREEIGRRMTFDEIYFQKASPAVAVNCGAGTFGLLYQTKE